MHAHIGCTCGWEHKTLLLRLRDHVLTQQLGHMQRLAKLVGSHVWIELCTLKMCHDDVSSGLCLKIKNRKFKSEIVNNGRWIPLRLVA